jgi:hypothetical protein
MIDPMILGGAAVGLVMGSFGYVLLRFGARPVFAYRRIKRRLAPLLAAEGEGALTAERRDDLRRLAVALQELVDEALPHWYALSLQKKNEHPREAVRHIQALVNSREPAAVRQRMAAVRKNLGLGGAPDPDRRR